VERYESFFTAGVSVKTFQKPFTYKSLGICQGFFLKTTYLAPSQAWGGMQKGFETFFLYLLWNDFL
jgi:hypothetical protein